MVQSGRTWRWLCVLFLLGGGGCSRATDEAPEVALDWRIAPTPPTKGRATLQFTLTDTTVAPPQLVTGAAVQVEGNMAHAGMAPVLTTAQEVSPGRYEAPLEFTMGGDWFILLTATLPDGRTLHRQLDVPGVR